ncbi:predicted protein [Arabidopsis lyrata subsp. lyrata]|uniref:Predicted protein n=1 Tax=Arabidopsis lyrata subsp. lyrata TaxID=81972 RepID=D7KTS3_ARALL|nr:predicted protein [Arabidopsis lyrata subsp. lyrata]
MRLKICQKKRLHSVKVFESFNLWSETELPRKKKVKNIREAPVSSSDNSCFLPLVTASSLCTDTLGEEDAVNKGDVADPVGSAVAGAVAGAVPCPVAGTVPCLVAGQFQVG